MTTVKEMEVKLNGHEKECAVRYANIEKQLDQGSQRFDKLNSRLDNFDKRLWLLYPLVIVSPFIDRLIQ
tara:strand:- start:562 stop:768 length:207 start_codon:yes stop_codon:yes gene_type:complete